MDKMIKLSQIREDRLERFCDKYNWVYPLPDDLDKEFLYQTLSKDDLDYYLRGDFNGE